MEETKKKNVGLYIVIIILILLCAGLGAFILLNKDKCTTVKENTTNTSETKSNDTIENSPFDISKSLNSENNNYTLSCQGRAGIWVTVDSTQKNLTFSFTPSSVTEEYDLNWTSDDSYSNSNLIEFDQKIVDIFFGGMGQSSYGDTLFILLEDGTVEYIPIMHMFNHAQSKPISYGKIEGVSDVTRFVLASANGGVTVLGIRNDGSYYDMWFALKDTGYYE